jgi:putative heme-binding domain-containing protein
VKLHTIGLIVWSAAAIAAQQSPADAPYPGANLTRQQILDRLTAATYQSRPSVAEGKQTYQTLCAACHVFGDIGTSLGPDLSTVGSRFKKKDLLESILWPSRTISDQYVMTTLTLDDGTTESGLIQREDANVVFLKNAANLEGRGLPVPVARIKERKDSTTSLMPEGLVAGLKLEQIDNLAAFLATGK